MIDARHAPIDLVPPGTEADINFLPGGGVSVCASTTGATIQSTTTVFKARNAPAPAACAIAACS